jgi:hypothetical protein
MIQVESHKMLTYCSKVACHLNHKLARVMLFLVICGNRRGIRCRQHRPLEGFLAREKDPAYARTYYGYRKESIRGKAAEGRPKTLKGKQ